jgi:hypothetical protein
MADRILAIIALVLALLIPPAGLIIGIIALTKHAEGRGLAIAATIIGAIGTFALPMLIFIGSAAYFGVLNPSSMIPEKCTFGAGIGCMDYAHVNDGASSRFELQIVNRFGREIDISEARFSSPDLSGTCEAIYEEPLTIKNGETVTIIAEGPGCMSQEESIRSSVEIDYARTSGISTSRTVLGEIYVRKT